MGLRRMISELLGQGTGLRRSSPTGVLQSPYERNLKTIPRYDRFAREENVAQLLELES